MRKVLFQFGPLWPLMRYDNNDKCFYKVSKKSPSSSFIVVVINCSLLQTHTLKIIIIA